MRKKRWIHCPDCSNGLVPCPVSNCKGGFVPDNVFWMTNVRDNPCFTCNPYGNGATPGYVTCTRCGGAMFIQEEYEETRSEKLIRQLATVHSVEVTAYLTGLYVAEKYGKRKTKYNRAMFEEYFAHLDEIIRLNPSYVDEAYVSKAELLDRLGEYNEALDACELALRINPRSEKAQQTKAKILAKLKQ